MNQILNKDLILPGIMLMVSGFIINSIKSIPIQLLNLIIKHLTTTIEIPDTDESFHYIKDFLSKQRFIGGLRYLNVSTQPNDFLLSPAPGKHYFIHKGRLAWVRRYRKELENGDKKSLYENISVTVFTRKTDILSTILATAKSDYFSNSEDTIEILTSMWGYWMPPKRHPTRQLDSVVLDKNLIEEIDNDLNRFINNKKLYHDRGIPYRKGYLFYGTPGSGKTSLIKALATKYGRPIAILPLSDKDVTDTKLIYLMSSLPKDSFVLIEDIDCLFRQREEKDTLSVTFAGLLNALDGVASPEGIVTFMTTNHKEQLDEALIRPGRIDKQVEFGPASSDQIVKMIHRFFPGIDHAEMGQILLSVPEEASMAKVQELLLSY